MTVTEANIIFVFFHCHIYHLNSFLEDFSYSFKIHESILMSSFMRHLRRSLKFWQCRKKWWVDSASRLQEQVCFIVSWKLCINVFSLRWLKGTAQRLTKIYLRLAAFTKCLKWVFKVYFRKLLEGRYQGQILVVGVSVGKCPNDVSRGNLSMAVVP